MLNELNSLIREVVSFIGEEELGANLALRLNEAYPKESNIFKKINKLCISGIDARLMCQNEHGGIKFGKVAKDIDGFSVDVVLMEDVVGPHHMHPLGEIDLVMPISEGATFDGSGPGWLVYGPNSDHNPTVSGGKAIILYLLPKGMIEFT